MISALNFWQILKQKKFVAVIRNDSYQEAFKIVECLIKVKVEIIEVTLTTPDAIQLITYFHQKYPNVYVGAGTVCNLSQLHTCLNAGAQFIVSPHFVEEIDQYCNFHQIAYLPGIATPLEAMKALKNSNKILKLFPADLLGPKFVKNLKKPYPFLQIMPSGGVNLANLKDWLAAGVCAVSVGTNLTEHLTEDEISKNVQKYLEIIHYA